MTEKKGFSAIRRRQQELQQAPVQEQTVVQPPAKMGRPTRKDPDRKYVKIGANVPIELRERMKLGLLTYLKGVHLSQDELIETAIRNYLQHWDTPSGS